MAAIRAGNGCTDNDNNSTDLVAATPVPRNISTALAPCIVVPITLQNFSANKNGSNNELHWQVNCLSGSVTFELQRSADGSEFKTIYTSVETKARCASPFTYSDVTALNGANYYRLKIIDIDGVVAFSKVCLAVNNIGDRNILRIQPTIVSSQVSMQYISSASEKVEWVITDMQGRIAKKVSTPVISGDNKIVIAVTDLSRGLYQITGYTGLGSTTARRFIKQ